MSSSSVCSHWRGSRRIRTWMANYAKWRGMRMWTWPTEVGDEHPDRAVADGVGDTGIESGGSQAGELAGASVEERAELRGLSRGVAELRGGSTKDSVSAGATAVGTFPLCENL